MTGSWLPVSLAMLFSCRPLQAQDASTITQTELTRRTQEIYDAAAPGDRQPWLLYFADNVIFCDEQGHVMDKSALIELLEPLPAGYNGTIRIAKAEARFAEGVAILSYEAIETETVFGRVLHARYHMTDTWLYCKRAWKIVASQTLRYYEDPAVGTIPQRLLNDYVGTYQLAPGTVKIGRAHV